MSAATKTTKNKKRQNNADNHYKDCSMRISPYQKRVMILDILSTSIAALWGSKTDQDAKEQALKALELVIQHYSGYLQDEEPANKIMQEAGRLTAEVLAKTGKGLAYRLGEAVAAAKKIAVGHCAGVLLLPLWQQLEQIDNATGKGLLQSGFSALNRAFKASSNTAAQLCYKNLLEELKLQDIVIETAQELLAVVALLDLPTIDNCLYSLTLEQIKEIYYAAFCNLHIELAQVECLEVFKVVDKLCRQQQINYTAIGGTILGAVRHQGFIPWDDDIDIILKRDDFERFVQVAADKLPNGYQLNWHNTIDYWWSGMARVMKTQDSKFARIYQKKNEGVVLEEGSNIDVFPLDCTIDKEALAAKIQWSIKRALSRSLYNKHDIPVEMKGVSAYLLWLLGKVVSQKTLVGLLNKCVTFYNHNKKTKAVMCTFGVWSRSKETHRKEVFSDIIYLPFEDTLMPVPVGYHELLTSTYGDYLNYPPVEKRISTHRNKLKAAYNQDRVAIEPLEKGEQFEG